MFADCPEDTASSAPSATSTAPVTNPQDSGEMTVGAQIGLAIGCAFGAAVVTIVATWYRPRQIGRFITCGKWPRKTETTSQARADMRYLLWPFAPRYHQTTQLVI